MAGAVIGMGTDGRLASDLRLSLDSGKLQSRRALSITERMTDDAVTNTQVLAEHILVIESNVIRLSQQLSDEKIKALAWERLGQYESHVSKLTDDVARILNVFITAGEEGRFPTRAELNAAVAGA